VLATNDLRTGNNFGRVPRQTLYIVVLGLFSCWAFPAVSATVTVKDLVEHGEQYHQRTVAVTGKASNLKVLTGPRNLPFYTFILRDKLESAEDVTVIMQGKPEVMNDDHVYVYGVFIKSRKAGRTTITNRIEATIVEQLHDQRLPLIG
jgi:hypothetical protein